MSSMPPFLMTIDRDSVHAGDDVDSHAVTVVLDPDASLGEAVATALTMCCFPNIHGGAATWIIAAGCDGPLLGVVDQRWQQPRLRFAADTPARDHMSSTKPALYFHYWCQADPDSVWIAVRDEAALPPRY